jgi:phage terminase large subunit-like protein
MVKRRRVSAVTAEAFLRRLRWLDGRPLWHTMEPYRRDLLTRALDTRRADGVPQFNFVLAGRGKKNWKSCDLVLAALYCLTIREGGGYILANDEDQAGDDLDLAKKLVACNADLAAELVPFRKEIRRRDDRAALKILPSKDVVGLHGKTAMFTGFDEIHGYRNYDLLEALAPDPTRPDTLTWITSYDTIWSTPGVPLADFKTRGKAGDDPRMLFSWYSGDYCTDAAFAELEPELRANPSISSWPDGRAYLDQQRQRLPTHKFRRLHLNLPGAPEGAYFNQASVLRAVVTGRKSLPYVEGMRYWAFVDMAGGGADDCVLAIGHTDADGRLVVDLVVRQAGERQGGTYNPLLAVAKFADIMREYHVTKVVLDGYAGHTFRHLFEEREFVAEIRSEGKTEFYEVLEVAINAGEVELLDDPIVVEQLLTLVLRAGGQKIDHLPGEHDDHCNAVAGLVWAMRRDARLVQYEPAIVVPFVAGQPRSFPGSTFEW